MNDLMNSVSSQIQGVISEAITEHISPQIQATHRSGQGQVPRKGWSVPAERPKFRPDEAFTLKCWSSSRDEFPRSLIEYEDRRKLMTR